jgi:beta-lactam-binding protein with PASTA domain/tRNA A-37 threonylcarbamoyl transferase component Bud32
MIGRVVDGRYAVEARVARGGMATVYRARDRRLDREVALKVMHAHLADDPEFTDRFIREARSAARLSEPGVVAVFDQGEDDGLLFLAMEYLKGRTLREVLGERGVLTPAEALDVVEPVLAALAAAHAAGIVHRDVKPENVILTDDGRIKVADFGLARAASTATSTSGVLMGTVAYLAPELVARGVADARTDVYAVGVMLFEMLTGRQPFTGDVPIQVAYRHVHEEVPVPSSVVPGLPEPLDVLVATAAARDPGDRPRDAAALLALERSARSRIPAAALTVRPALPRPPRGRPYPAGVPGHTQLLTPEEHGEPARLLGARAGAAGVDRYVDRDVHRDAHRDVHRDVDRDVDRDLGGDGDRDLDGDLDPDGDRDRDPLAAETQVLARWSTRRRRRGAVALVALLAAAAGLGVWAWWFALGPGAFTTLPALTGQDATLARAGLTALDLRSTTRDVYDDTVPARHVVASHPGEGGRVPRAGTVVLDVSLGPRYVPVPDVAGASAAEAGRRLSAAGLVVAGAGAVYDSAPVGTIVRTWPAAGQLVASGAAVTVTPSRGPRPVAVPDVRGLTTARAAARLRTAGLAVAYGPARFDDRADPASVVPAGRVLRQTPARGTVAPGSRVRVVVSKGPVLVGVPSVVGLQLATARARLEAAGLRVEATRYLGGLFGTVRTQSAPPGERIARGSTISLLIV